MALQHTRLISKVFSSRLLASRPQYILAAHNSRRHQSGEGDSSSSSGAPYRPWPFNKHRWPESGAYWEAQGWTPQSEEDDKHEDEEVYLSEIEARLASYDKKWSDSDRVKSLYNEFGWEAIDDRANYNYGGPLSGTQYGEGKKINPGHYITPEWIPVMRRTVPPIQYMTAEQIRRSRGMLASTREVPPEQDSIWKYWNGYSCLGVFSALMVTKEFFVTGGHDMFEAVLMWTIFGTAAAFIGDWIAWWHTLTMQEYYDRQYFPLIRQVEKLNARLESINSKPNEKQLVSQLTTYREMIAEKVLNKTLANRLSRSLDATVAKLEAKITEEQMVKKEAETSWKRSALEQTVDYFDNDDIRQEFMRDALASFCSGNTAAFSKKNVSFETDMFSNQYRVNFDNVKSEYLAEQRSKGTLSAVFLDDAERAAKAKSNAEKRQEYEEQVRQWVDTHNPVQLGNAFA